mgnify:CR=1 FL=1
MKKEESILFTTWIPNRTKFPAEKDPGIVTKRDVRYIDENNKPTYIAVLVQDGLRKVDTSEYKPWGRNNDYQFQLYAKPPCQAKANFWAMKVIASNPSHSYNFVCLVDSSFMSPENTRLGQQRQFIEDIKRFATQ